MARGRTARTPKDDAGEVKPMDFDRAKDLYFADIKPAKSEASSQGQSVAEAMKIIKKHCHIDPQAARKAFSSFELEDAHREVHIRGFVGMFNALMGAEILTCNFGDLVDQMQGDASSTPAKPKLVTVAGAPPADDSDLADAGLTEASAEELAQQEGRGQPAPGTGAAAIAAMKDAVEPTVET